MIINDFSSQLHIRLHIAEMMKDKIEQDNYIDLCEKALSFALNGITLPLIAKNPFEEAMGKLTTIFNQEDDFKAIKPKSKEDELKDLFEQHKGKKVKYNGIECILCGYSSEFDCLIIGCVEPILSGYFSKNSADYIDWTLPLKSYSYVSKDIVKQLDK